MSPVVRYGSWRPKAYSGSLIRHVSTWNASLENIRKHNATINAYIAVEDDKTLKALAMESEKRKRNGTSIGPLDGMPIAIKDNFCTTSLPTSCGSKSLKGFISPYDATVVRLLKESGAIIMGKTNMDEFGMGAANVFSHFGPVINPHGSGAFDNESCKRRVAGGSSGGSAAAVAAKMCVAALGSDTGGSVRLPASYCGVVGFKPSYGRSSRYGLVAYANSLDTVGIFSRTVQDAALVFDAISKFDANDPTSMPIELRSLVDVHDQELAAKWNTDDLTGLRVGVPKEYYVEPISEDVVRVWRDGIRQLRKQGATIVPISLPHTKYALSTYYTIALAEASSNLARYDGVRYGHRSDVADTAKSRSLYAVTRTEGFGTEVKRRIMLGTHILTAGAYEKSFLPAQKTRRLIQKDFDSVFRQPNILHTKESMQASRPVHVILVPTAMSYAPTVEESQALEPPKGEKSSKAGMNSYVNDVMSVPASLAGLPAICVPFGKSSKEGLPIGLQLISQYGYDRFLLRISEALNAS